MKKFNSKKNTQGAEKNKRNKIVQLKNTKKMNIIGRLTADASVQNLSNDKTVVNFSVATNESYRNKQGEKIEQTTFFDCSYWLSAKVAKILTKGALVELTGRVSARAWTSSDGLAKAGLNFHTSTIKLHQAGQRAETQHQPIKEQAYYESYANYEIDDDLPF